MHARSHCTDRVGMGMCCVGGARVSAAGGRKLAPTHTHTEHAPSSSRSVIVQTEQTYWQADMSGAGCARTIDAVRVHGGSSGARSAAAEAALGARASPVGLAGCVATAACRIVASPAAQFARRCNCATRIPGPSPMAVDDVTNCARSA